MNGGLIAGKYTVSYAKSILVIKRILKINILMKPELFVLGLMGSQLEKTHWLSIHYLEQVYYMHKDEKNTETPTMVKVKMMEYAEMANLTNLIRDKTISTLINV